MMLTRDECLRQAANLADTPQNCIARHALRSGRGRAWGDQSALIVDADVTRGELLAFGEDVVAIARLLAELPDWKCVEVAPSIADELASALERRLSCEIGRVADLYFTLSGQFSATIDDRVRLLEPVDAENFARSSASYCVSPEDAKRNVIEGPVVAAFVDDAIVAASEANVRTQCYANFTVSTLPPFRDQGLGTATARLAAKIVSDMDLTPLWSCAETNHASRRVAAKVGFAPVGHCVYLIPRR